MIILQDEIDTRPVKVEWYWSEKRPEVDDGKLREVHPFFVIQESRYVWEEAGW